MFARLKGLLKRALRQFRFRAVRCTYADGRSLDLGAYPMAPTKDRLSEAICKRLARVQELTASIHTALPSNEADTSDTAGALLQLDAVVVDLEDVLSVVRGDPEPDGEPWKEI